MVSSFMEYFKILPVEITLDILARLPTESVLECKLVSKTWNNLVSHQSFSGMHFHHNNPSTADSGKLSVLALTGDAKFHYFDYTEIHESTPIVRIRRMNIPSPWESVRFVSSCNGLICLSESPRSQVTIVICNPITREHVRLPQIKFDCDIDDVYWTSGFGYVSSTNEYKVVAIVSTTVLEVHIYTLGSGSGWRKLENLYEYLLDSIFHWDQGVFANGALYWKDIEPEMITAFDLVEEKFDELLSPPPSPPEPESEWSDHKIGVLDGFLFFATYRAIQDAESFDIWLLKSKNGNHDKKEGEENLCSGWSKEFRIRFSTLLAIAKNGAVLTQKGWDFSIYDTETSTSKRLVNLKEYIREVIPHRNTLVSLKELGEEDTEIMESIEFTGQIAVISQL